ncbi:MAG TPA: PrsW family intramembrane metalloprotease [Micromonosporaceae bacterium]|nr:PrsW family intramembrane metalloprotease [Micromonosporaceae bacterium]
MTRPYSPVRIPTFWLLTATVAIGTPIILLLFGILTWTAPRAALVSLAPMAAYTLLWLAAIRYVDHLARRPWWLVLLAFAWGATGAVLVGGGAGLTLDNLLAQLASPEFAAEWGAALVAPTAEEIAKGAGVVLLLLAARPHLSTVTAGMVYGAIIGVGFAAVEDISYAMIAADETLPDDVGEALRTLALRATLPGVVGHPLFTAVVGAGVAYCALRRDRTRARRWGVLVGASTLAWLMHAAVNSPLAFLAAEALDRRGLAPLAGYFLVVGVPAAIALQRLLVLRRNETSLRVRGFTGAGIAAEPVASAPAFGAEGPAFVVATEEEARVLASRRARTRTVRVTRRRFGTAGARAVRRLHQAQVAFLDLPPDPPPVPPQPAPPPPTYFPPPPPVPVAWPPRVAAVVPGTAPVPAGVPWPPPAGWGYPAQWAAPAQWTVPRWWPTEAGRARAELAAARAELSRLTGCATPPVVTAPSSPASHWLTPAAVGLTVAGLLHWVVPAVAALVLAGGLGSRSERRIPGLITAVVAATGYVWLAGVVLALLYPGQL